MGYRWKPSRAAKAAFAARMDEIDAFCEANGIIQSRSSDSYYFTLEGQRYRVSNHTIAASNRAAYDELTGEQTRRLYHDPSEAEDLIQITAGKTRIMEIYRDLAAGAKLDRRGYRID